MKKHWSHFCKSWRSQAATQFATLSVLTSCFVVISLAVIVHQNIENILFRWGREVRVSPTAADRIAETVEPRAGTCQAKRDMTSARPLHAWQTLGVRLPGGEALPRADVDAALVKGTRRQFLVYRNYDALLDYNCAHAYAISVGLLADRIGS